MAKKKECTGEKLLREILEKLNKSLVYGEVLREVVNRLEKQNTDLLDRLMARNYPELKTYVEEPSTSDSASWPSTGSLDIDENMAGEVLEGTTEEPSNA